MLWLLLEKDLSPAGRVISYALFESTEFKPATPVHLLITKEASWMRGGTSSGTLKVQLPTIQH